MVTCAYLYNAYWSSPLSYFADCKILEPDSHSWRRDELVSSTIAGRNWKLKTRRKMEELTWFLYWSLLLRKGRPFWLAIVRTDCSSVSCWFWKPAAARFKRNLFALPKRFVFCGHDELLCQLTLLCPRLVRLGSAEISGFMIGEVWRFLLVTLFKETRFPSFFFVRRPSPTLASAHF